LLRASKCGVKIISLTTGRALYEKNGDKLFVPASALKAFTAAAALFTLGPDYQIMTSVWADGDIKDGVLHGDLYLKGEGNPQLHCDDVKDLVHQVKGQGILSITGKIYVDAFDFDGQSQGPGWMWDDEPAVLELPDERTHRQPQLP
jgi:D-alanyl-D-alanine carboxypeptidase/D-alanyl-D-alanine-endopeptidase (penicillin-binding protein 4)